MTKRSIPWYVRVVIGLAAWITAVVLTLLGGTTVFGLLGLDNLIVLAVFGLMYLAFGIRLLRESASSIFLEQLGLAAALAGAVTITVSLSVELDSVWLGLLIAILILGIVMVTTADVILQFLLATLVAGFYFGSLQMEGVKYGVGLAALTTPLGLFLLLRPQSRDLTPIATAFLLAFPIASIGISDLDLYFMRNLASGDLAVKILHTGLFLWLIFSNWGDIGDQQTRYKTIGFSIVATLICVLLPPGGSAAMLLLTLAYVIGSVPFALLGMVLQSQFVVRYYYSLDMSLLNKSLLLMAVGLLLSAFWWLIRRADPHKRSV